MTIVAGAPSTGVQALSAPVNPYRADIQGGMLSEGDLFYETLNVKIRLAAIIIVMYKRMHILTTVIDPDERTTNMLATVRERTVKTTKVSKQRQLTKMEQAGW
jgi:hypothetical protein